MAEDMNTQVINEFRANAGKVGGFFDGAPMVILHTTGAKSGRELTTPLMYQPDDADPKRIFIFASAGGAPKHPAWFHNVLAHPEVTIEVGADTFSAHAEEVKGAQRDAIYAEQARRFDNFAEYKKLTDRVIPVVALNRE